MGDYSLLRVLHPFYPSHQEIDDARLAFQRNLSSFGNLPPLFKTASAAGCRCVLSLEDGMSAHGSLSSVVRRIRRRKARADEVGGMAPYRRHAFIRNILSVCRRKPETRSELRSCKLRERFINSHLLPRNHQPPPMTCAIISFILSRICVRECVGRKSRYRRMQFGILGNGFGNTGCEALVMGENRGRYGCKDCLYMVKGRWTTREGQRPRCPCGGESRAARTLPLP